MSGLVWVVSRELCTAVLSTFHGLLVSNFGVVGVVDVDVVVAVVGFFLYERSELEKKRSE